MHSTSHAPRRLNASTGPSHQPAAQGRGTAASAPFSAPWSASPRQRSQGLQMARLQHGGSAASRQGALGMQQAGSPPLQRALRPGAPIQCAKYGDSGKLARERWKLKPLDFRRRHNFKKWKRGREAQHLIPAQVGKHYGIPRKWINSARNGMMMPSGRRATNHLRDTRLDKGKLHHIKGGGAHPNYNKHVHALANAHQWTPGGVTKHQFRALAGLLRLKNRPRRTGAAKGYVDEIK